MYSFEIIICPSHKHKTYDAVTTEGVYEQGNKKQMCRCNKYIAALKIAMSLPN